MEFNIIVYFNNIYEKFFAHNISELVTCYKNVTILLQMSLKLRLNNDNKRRKSIQDFNFDNIFQKLKNCEVSSNLNDYIS